MYIHEVGYAGGEDVVLPEDVSNFFTLWVSMLTNASQLGVSCPMTSWEEYIKLEDWTKVLANLK